MLSRKPMGAGEYAYYYDYSSMASLAHRFSKMYALPLPVQRSNGDCWLWSTVAALHIRFPSLFVGMIRLSPDFATVHFPRGQSVRINYTFCSTREAESICTVALERCEDLYWGLLAKAICLKLNGDTSQLDGTVIDYSQLDGGMVSEALNLLSKTPCLPPVLVKTADVSLALDKNFTRGLFFCEEERSETFHSMAILGKYGNNCIIAWDPWGRRRYLSPSDNLTILFYQWAQPTLQS